MFTSTYKVQMPRGTMIFNITIKCRQLNEQDEQLEFNLTDFCHLWWIGESSQDYKATPHALCLGLWLAISDKIKSSSNSLARDLVAHSVELEAPGLTIRFGLDN
jgi:hypothetical protein